VIDLLLQVHRILPWMKSPALVFLLTLGSWPADAESASPSIVFVLAAGPGAGDLHCAGHPHARTLILQ
jgi:hypothetical protein